MTLKEAQSLLDAAAADVPGDVEYCRLSKAWYLDGVHIGKKVGEAKAGIEAIYAGESVTATRKPSTGAWCQRCGGPVADGSGLCYEC